jgi:hypothetical protein
MEFNQQIVKIFFLLVNAVSEPRKSKLDLKFFWRYLPWREGWKAFVVSVVLQKFRHFVCVASLQLEKNHWN